MARTRFFGSVDFTLYKTVKTKKEAKAIAKKLRKDGFYARVIPKKDEIEVWASNNPRWFWAEHEDKWTSLTLLDVSRIGAKAAFGLDEEKKKEKGSGNMEVKVKIPDDKEVEHSLKQITGMLWSLNLIDEPSISEAISFIVEVISVFFACRFKEFAQNNLK